jgi:hypothetical protein
LKVEFQKFIFCYPAFKKVKAVNVISNRFLIKHFVFVRENTHIPIKSFGVRLGRIGDRGGGKTKTGDYYGKCNNAADA